MEKSYAKENYSLYESDYEACQGTPYKRQIAVGYPLLSYLKDFHNQQHLHSTASFTFSVPDFLFKTMSLVTRHQSLPPPLPLALSTQEMYNIILPVLKQSKCILFQQLRP
jgi:hypothetical protein